MNVAREMLQEHAGRIQVRIDDTLRDIQRLEAEVNEYRIVLEVDRRKLEDIEKTLRLLETLNEETGNAP